MLQVCGGVGHASVGKRIRHPFSLPTVALTPLFFSGVSLTRRRPHDADRSLVGRKLLARSSASMRGRGTSEMLPLPVPKGGFRLK